ncbi:MAG: hypothetical protein GXW99_05390 [Clostridiales bacterium]|nr:hypothetical protein [Clostridiales bacterium]
MFCVQNRHPVDYSMCNQTVTVYHWDGKTAYTRTVYRNAFLDFKKTQNVDKTGSKEANSFLLVIPCAVQGVFVGDKVLLGEGAECATREAWAALVPSTTPGLVVAKYVDPKYWRGAMCHMEAGG